MNKNICTEHQKQNIKILNILYKILKCVKTVYHMTSINWQKQKQKKRTKKKNQINQNDMINIFCDFKRYKSMTTMKG